MGTAAASSRRAANGRRTGRLFLGPAAYGFAVLAIRASLLVALLMTAYLLWGLFSPQTAHFAQLARPERVRVLGNIHLAGNLLLFSCLVAAVVGAVAFFAEEIAGYTIALAGAALYVGIPFCITFFLDTQDFHSNAARRSLLGALSGAGTAPFLIGGAMVALDVVRRLAGSLQSRTLRGPDLLRYGAEADSDAAAVGRRPLRTSLLAKCWEGRFCRDFVRVHCPIFQTRKACWRVKRGCYCEDDIVATAAARMAGIPLPMAPDGRYNFANSPSPGHRKVELTPGEKRERCRHCVIYLDHQRQKYGLLMPIVIGGVFALALLFSPLLRDVLRHGLAGIEIVMSHFSWGDSGQGVSFRLGRPSPTVEWVLVGALTIMALSKVLEALEWAIFKAKI